MNVAVESGYEEHRKERGAGGKLRRGETQFLAKKKRCSLLVALSAVKLVLLEKFKSCFRKMLKRVFTGECDV